MAEVHPLCCDCDACLNAAPVKVATAPRTYELKGEPLLPRKPLLYAWAAQRRAESRSTGRRRE